MGAKVAWATLVTSANNSGALVLRTLADYHDFELTAFCRDCDRSVVLDKAQLADQYGSDMLLEEIRRRLTCQQCGRRPERLLVGFSQAARPDG